VEQARVTCTSTLEPDRAAIFRYGCDGRGAGAGRAAGAEPDEDAPEVLGPGMLGLKEGDALPPPKDESRCPPAADEPRGAGI